MYPLNVFFTASPSLTFPIDRFFQAAFKTGAVNIRTAQRASIVQYLLIDDKQVAINANTNPNSPSRALILRKALRTIN
jgi:hypothetical protein